jgi:hypothetical protein
LAAKSLKYPEDGKQLDERMAQNVQPLDYKNIERGIGSDN